MDSNLEMLVECEHCGNSIELLGTKEAVKYLPKSVHFGSLNRYAVQKKIPALYTDGGYHFRKIDLINFTPPQGRKRVKTNDTTATS